MPALLLVVGHAGLVTAARTAYLMLPGLLDVRPERRHSVLAFAIRHPRPRPHAGRPASPHTRPPQSMAFEDGPHALARRLPDLERMVARRRDHMLAARR